LRPKPLQHRVGLGSLTSNPRRPATGQACDVRAGAPCRARRSDKGPRHPPNGRGIQPLRGIEVGALMFDPVRAMWRTVPMAIVSAKGVAAQCFTRGSSLFVSLRWRPKTATSAMP
jgi:hypothetical protein